jgi:DNA polymerase/3'-5' exonuclease PolX
LVAAGINSIADLRDNTDMLNDKQRLGLKYYDDIKKRIPRDEIEEFNKTFKKIFDKVAPNGSKFEVVGSYRRGAKTSGDIDIIITNDKDNRDAFDNVLDQLLKDNIITAVLSRGKTKSMTVVEIKKDGPKRRVDFLYSPPDEYAFALFYFTGSKIFNTVVRQKAVDLGYTLNEHGLSYFTKGVKGKKVDKEFPTEESIMNFLDIKYKKPEERIDGRSIVKVGGAGSKTESKTESKEPSVKENKIEKTDSVQEQTMIITPKKSKKKKFNTKKNAIAKYK